MKQTLLGQTVDPNEMRVMCGKKVTLLSFGSKEYRVDTSVEDLAKAVRDPLRSQCPKFGDDTSKSNTIILTEKGQDHILACAIFLLESKSVMSEANDEPTETNLKSDMVQYFIRVARHLDKVEFGQRKFSSSKLPDVENFGFWFTTVLSDCAVKFPEHQAALLSAQVKLVKRLCKQLKESFKSGQVAINKAISLSQTTIPLLLGAVRAIGRFGSTDSWLTSKLFPAESLANSKPVLENRFPTIPDYPGFSNFSCQTSIRLSPVLQDQVSPTNEEGGGFLSPPKVLDKYFARSPSQLSLATMILDKTPSPMVPKQQTMSKLLTIPAKAIKPKIMMNEPPKLLNYRSIIPKSMTSLPGTGGTLKRSDSADSIVDLSFRPTLRSDLMVHQNEKRNLGAGGGSVSAGGKGGSHAKENDPSWYFFNTFGSCFNQLQVPLTSASSNGVGSNIYPVDLFKDLFNLAKEMLSGEFLAFYDKIASEAFKSGIIKNFPYKSLSEMLNLVFTSMIRELVVNCQIPDLSSDKAREVGAFIRDIFVTGQNELQASGHAHDQDDQEKDHGGHAKGGAPSVVNRSKLNVITNAVCVDILVWATNDEQVKRYLSAGGFMIPGDQFMKSFLAFVLKIHSESDDLEGDGSETKRIGADDLVHKLSDKINVSSHKQLFAHLPLITVCIECLGKIAEKFPSLAKQSADCLRDFLTAPATIMSKLSRLSSLEKPKALPEVLVTGSESTQLLSSTGIGGYRKSAKALQGREYVRMSEALNPQAPFSMVAKKYRH